MTKSYGYCDNCRMDRDFEIVEQETEFGKEYRRTHHGILPIGMGTDIKFICSSCGLTKPR